MAEKPLVGPVLERRSTTLVGGVVPFAGSVKSGFPQAQHRSKSVFGRAKEQKKYSSSPLTTPPVVSSKGTSIDESSSSSTDASQSTKRIELNDWRGQISDENQSKVESMTEEEREQSIRAIYEQLGPGVEEKIQKAMDARKRRKDKDNQDILSEERPTEGDSPRSSSAELNRLTDELMPVPFVTENERELSSRISLRLPPPALSTSSTRPSSRADRRLRFAEVTPNDVHVYESAPSSPRKKVLLLPPPDPSDSSVVSLGQFKNHIARNVEQSLQDAETNPSSKMDSDPDDDEGTPEYIRRRFFPDAPAHDPNVAWMESNSSPQTSSSSLRFDLNGAPIPPSISSTLPTHLGLHHHADGQQAGYTLDEIFLLCRSTAPPQRAMMLGVLARIARRLGDVQTRDVAELAGQENELRKRILAAGLEAMSEKGNVGIRAVEAIWQCAVCWDDGLVDIEGTELKVEKGSLEGTDVISFIPLEFFLPQVVTILDQRVFPTESQLQLLAVLHRLAKHSNDIASVIVKTSNLTSTVLRTFLLIPMSPTPTSPQPEPSAVQFLITVASSSRTNAVALVELADALLRFVILLPPDSPYPTSLAITLLTYTLRFYTVLASYGLYARIATTVETPLSQLRKFVESSLSAGTSNEPALALATLLETWIVCATDPHKTTPNHDILWSQVTGLGWHEDLLAWRNSLTATREHWAIWSAIWQAQAALLEGARLNEVKGGIRERQAILETLKAGFEDGRERSIVVDALNSLRRELHEIRSPDELGHLASFVKPVAAAMRLWLACVPTESRSLTSPPFILPFPQIFEVCAQVVNHPLWSSLYTEDTKLHAHVLCRPLTTLLFAFLGLSRMYPDVSDELWIAQSLSILCRSIPGDESLALRTLEQMVNLLNAEWMALRNWHVPPVIWERHGLDVIKPFFMNAIRSPEIFIGPLWPTPQSISLSTTQRLPSGTSVVKSSSLIGGLPLANDWILSPLDHLLRSGNSPVLQSLPSSWDSNEIEVVRASLLFAKIFQKIFHSFSMFEFMLTHEEVVFGCMKVFMLEHGQPDDRAFEEVYRDAIVEQLMNDLLTAFTVPSGSSIPRSVARTDLERVAIRFLGPDTPFYQFYTDFVALYDAVSFSHPLFARLLLPPASMRYPPDYRKLLWDDFGHILRTVRLTPEQVVGTEIKEFLWPVEQDVQVIQAYLSALVKYPLVEFVRLLAVHHIACNVWPDLQQGGATAAEKGGKKLLLAVVDMGSKETVREVVTYYQTPDETVLPPKCFEANGERQKSRLECLERWGDSSLFEKLRRLFEKT